MAAVPDLPVAIRAATPEDLDEVRSIEARYYGNMEPWPTRPDFLDHELAEGRMLVAERGGEVAGFAGAYVRSGVTYVADVFVRPALLGRRIGTSLLEVILDDAGDRLTLASSDPRALPLYARFGMHPMASLVYLRGGAQAATRLGASQDVRVVRSDPDAAASLEDAITGFARLEDHRFLVRAGAVPIVVTEGDDAFGFGHVRTVPGSPIDAYVGPVAGLRDLEVVVMAIVRFAAAGADRVHVALFEDGPALPGLHAAGFQEIGRDTLVATREDLVDRMRYAPLPELG